MSTPGIVDLVAVCERMAERNRSLFEAVGSWVATEPDPAVQRWFSAAAHRHAWHAELWVARQPTIPVDAPAPPPDVDGPGDDHVDWYLGRLESLTADVTELAGRVDPLLDPATARVARLIAADLDDLAAQAPTR